FEVEVVASDVGKRQNQEALAEDPHLLSTEGQRIGLRDRQLRLRPSLRSPTLAGPLARRSTLPSRPPPQFQWRNERSACVVCVQLRATTSWSCHRTTFPRHCASG